MSRVHEPYDKFKGWLRSNRMTYADLAELLGLSEATISLKINGQSDFLLCEIQKIMATYDLQSDIFFTSNVA